MGQEVVGAGDTCLELGWLLQVSCGDCSSGVAGRAAFGVLAEH